MINKQKQNNKARQLFVVRVPSPDECNSMESYSTGISLLPLHIVMVNVAETKWRVRKLLADSHYILSVQQLI